MCYVILFVYYNYKTLLYLLFTVKMEAVSFSESWLIFYQITRRHVPEDVGLKPNSVFVFSVVITINCGYVYKEPEIVGSYCGDSPQVAAVTLSSVKLCGVVWGIVTGVSGEITASVFRT